MGQNLLRNVKKKKKIDGSVWGEIAQSSNDV